MASDVATWLHLMLTKWFLRCVQRTFLSLWVREFYTKFHSLKCCLLVIAANRTPDFSSWRV